MSFLQDCDARRFFAWTAAVCAGLLLFALLLAGVQSHQLRAVLAEREETLTAALLEQGFSSDEIVRVLRHAEGSKAARLFLRQLGRGGGTPVWLLTEVRSRALRLLAVSLLGALLFAVGQFAGAIRYLRRCDALYMDAASVLNRYAESDFSCRLRCGREGSLGRLFSAAERVSTVLQAGLEAERRSRVFLKDILSDISHQLKTPLSALQMYTEIMAAEPGNVETVRIFTEKSLSAIVRMEGLTSALLKLARLDAGSIVFQPEPVRAEELAQRAAADLQTRAEREGKQLTLSGEPGALLVCDPAWTAEALGNLLKNALDHTPRGGSVTLRWECSPLLFRMTVTDTGEGIAPADLHHIFKRFYRAPSPRGKPGAGLGLPLARAILEGQGGLLSVQSEPGRGAVFTVSLPNPESFPASQLTKV